MYFGLLVISTRTSKYKLRIVALSCEHLRAPEYITKHKVQDQDLFFATNGHGKVMNGFLSLVRAFIVDMDITSERYRIFGDMRFFISSALQIFGFGHMIILVGYISLFRRTMIHFRKGIMIFQPYGDDCYAYCALVWVRTRRIEGREAAEDGKSVLHFLDHERVPCRRKRSHRATCQYI
ncbi:hypothetical protein DD238_006085 [Peronospora effusa]|uniref:Uncharacterized protein n=1 Tax=Peronospora effusa TaxID=542832 RepID=A0A3M6VHX5_9STRA|nr:hypothetical protein DD238_006085 [Peronospora effusa]